MSLFIIREGPEKQAFMIQILHRITMVIRYRIIFKGKQKTSIAGGISAIL